MNLFLILLLAASIVSVAIFATFQPLWVALGQVEYFEPKRENRYRQRNPSFRYFFIL